MTADEASYRPGPNEFESLAFSKMSPFGEKPSTLNEEIMPMAAPLFLLPSGGCSRRTSLKRRPSLQASSTGTRGLASKTNLHRADSGLSNRLPVWQAQVDSETVTTVTSNFDDEEDGDAEGRFGNAGSTGEAIVGRVVDVANLEELADFDLVYGHFNEGAGSEMDDEMNSDEDGDDYDEDDDDFERERFDTKMEDTDELGFEDEDAAKVKQRRWLRRYRLPRLPVARPWRRSGTLQLFAETFVLSTFAITQEIRLPN
ncbi:unnamed protein product [Protopolystoma xenopodis]|uniref:Uncharacterized protein n=1 Tax=Protopolystoma xenopodis TaxID=117903 RepID=A0A3S5FF28_9PLAT|nr:unnamed protein product [Protopolystoma xenopodis]